LRAWRVKSLGRSKLTKGEPCEGRLRESFANEGTAQGGDDVKVADERTSRNDEAKEVSKEKSEI
jgi:predicted nucleic acid-binding Zn ribbon protein